ncbi:MAG: extracellular solute-binding protein, partial [Clostridiales bacterium]|nr:extracellular solute-binding protein [Clostridiales bacterium]
MGISKRILTGILALIMAFSVIGCNSDEKKSDNDSNKEKKSVSTSTDTFTNPVTKATKVKSSNSEISTTKINPRPAEISIDKNLLMDSLPKTKLNNKVLKYYCYSDISPKLNLENSMASDIFSLKYGGEIVEERVDYSSYFDELAIKTLSGDSPDFLNAYNMDIFPIGVINELIQPIDDYIDLKSDIWSDTSEFADYFSVNGNHYAAVVDVLPQYVCVYNTNTIKLNGLEDPAELFKTGKWTFEKFSEMCINFTEPSKDKYGLDGYWYGSAISPTSGVPMISNKNGNLSLNLNNPFLEEVQNSIYDLVRKNVAFPKIDNNWLVRNNTYG